MKEVDKYLIYGIIGDYLKTVLRYDTGSEKVYINGVETNKKYIIELRKKFK